MDAMKEIHKTRLIQLFESIGSIIDVGGVPATWEQELKCRLRELRQSRSHDYRALLQDFYGAVNAHLDMLSDDDRRDFFKGILESEENSGARDVSGQYLIPFDGRSADTQRD